MHIDKVVKAQGKWAKRGVDIKNGDILTILDEGTDTTNNFDKSKFDKTFKIKTTNNEERIFSPNQTSLNNLVDAYGTETSNWVGKKVKAWILEGMVKGEWGEMLFLSSPDWTIIKGKLYPPTGNVKSDEEKELDDMDIEEEIPFN